MIPVMIVDDDAAIRDTVALVLKKSGCLVTKAAGGAACLEALRQGFRGVILMDIMMPDLDGWETIRALKAENLLPGSLVAMLTAKAAPDSGSEGLQEAVFDYLPKPFGPEELLALVRGAADCLAL